MFTVIVRLLWILLMTAPLAIAAFKIPGFTGHQEFGNFGTVAAYLYIACGVIPTAGLLLFTAMASRGDQKCLDHVREMLLIKDRVGYKARFYVNAIVLSTIILLLAIEAHIPAVLLAVVCLLSLTVYGHAEQVYSTIKFKPRETARRPAY